MCAPGAGSSSVSLVCDGLVQVIGVQKSIRDLSHLSARPLLQLPVGSTAGDAGAAEHILWSFNIYDLIPGLHINNLWETFNTRSKKYKNKTSVLSFQFSHTNTWFFSLFDVRP